MPNKHMDRVDRQYALMGGGGGGLERYRDRTPTEVVADGYMAITQVAALNAVTQMGMESLRQCDLKRQEVLAEHPNLEAPITGLLFNHARLTAEIQNSVANNDKRA
ncbi:hypothetical protein RB608_18160 [Nocardioides sp. LHD-245]|uniref:hypothetical protein n=1 Tax=Nocardioides sp. LHD-245 TaxID=3051387 RepID=UPI0027DED3A4|nr:hypothetical protein [Nocardioides sp. LHD-245]